MSAAGSRAMGITLPENENVNGNLTANGVASFAEGAAVTTTSNYSHAYGNNVHTNGIEGVLIQGKNGWAKNLTADSNQTEYSIQLAYGDNATGSAGPNGIGMILTCEAPAPAPNGFGSASSWTTSGADYAEYFEWKDGNVAAEDRIGYFVTLEKDKIKKCDVSEEVVGIITATAGVIGDAAELAWSGTNNKDEFGRDIKELSYKYAILDKYPEKYSEVKHLPDDEKLLEIVQVTPVEIVRPSKDFISEKEYIPRRFRKEWSPVGLMGKIYVRDNGKCLAGEKCGCQAGIAVPGNHWRVLKRVNENVIQVLFK